MVDSSKLKEFSDDNFKFDENGRKFFRRVENTVGQGKIVSYEQLLLFSHCFQKTCTAVQIFSSFCRQYRSRSDLLLNTGVSNQTSHDVQFNHVFTSSAIFQTYLAKNTFETRII